MREPQVGDIIITPDGGRWYGTKRRLTKRMVGNAGVYFEAMIMEGTHAGERAPAFMHALDIIYYMERGILRYGHPPELHLPEGL